MRAFERVCALTVAALLVAGASEGLAVAQPYAEIEARWCADPRPAYYWWTPPGDQPQATAHWEVNLQACAGYTYFGSTSEAGAIRDILWTGLAGDLPHFPPEPHPSYLAAAWCPAELPPHPPLPASEHWDAWLEYVPVALAYNLCHYDFVEPTLASISDRCPEFCWHDGTVDAACCPLAAQGTVFMYAGGDLEARVATDLLPICGSAVPAGARTAGTTYASMGGRAFARDVENGQTYWRRLNLAIRANGVVLAGNRSDPASALDPSVCFDQEGSGPSPPSVLYDPRANQRCAFFCAFGTDVMFRTRVPEWRQGD